MLALFTTGPVGFSDAAGRSNATLLWRIAVADGTLVQPSRPLISSDRVYSAFWKKGHHGYGYAKPTPHHRHHPPP